MTEYEKQKVIDMVRGMTEEELSVVASAMPSRIMFDELSSRTLNNERKLEAIEEFIKIYEEH